MDAGVLALAAAAPNPFTGSAAPAFTLPRAGRAVPALEDVSGRLVKSVLNGACVTRLTCESEERVGKIVRLR